MSYKIDFLGLIYFYHQSGGRLLLLPDGTAGKDGIEPHYASFFLETKKVIIDDTTWTDVLHSDGLDAYGVSEYSIKYPSMLSISGADTAVNGGCLPFGIGGGIESSHDSKVPHLKDCAADMHIDPALAQTIAKLPIRQGTLEAFLLPEGAIVSRLTVTNHTGPIAITANYGNETKRIVVRDETEIVLSNTSDFAGSHGQHPALADGREPPSHFQLYSKLADDGKPHYLTVPTTTPNLPQFPSSQAYILFLLNGGQVPAPDCSNSCC